MAASRGHAYRPCDRIRPAGQAHCMAMRSGIGRTVCVLLFSATIGTLTACGQTEDERARRTAEDFADSVIARDFAATCDLFSPAYQQRLDGASGCRASQEVQWARPVEQIEVVEVLAKKRRGIAKLEIARQGIGPSPLTLVLKRPEGRWLIVGQR